MPDTTDKFEYISRRLFVLSCLLLAFLYGMIAEKYHFFPYNLLHGVYEEAEAYIKSTKNPHHLFPVRYQNAGAKSYNADAVAPGLTLITSYWRDFDWKPGICLIDTKGNVLHRWPTDPAAIWPASPHKDLRAGKLNVSQNYVHGSYLFENGDIVFNIEYLGLVRMNACGEIVWRLPYRTHHSIFRTETGDFWVSGMKWIEDTPEGSARLAGYPGMRPSVVEDFALKVSADGNIIEEISLLDALYKNEYQYLFWKIGKKRRGDIAHLNKIEELSSRMADQYPLFEPGDLLISMKYIHAVFVLDPSTGEIKWLTTGPFMQQHDPKFIGNGWIAIFDNNTDGSQQGLYLGGSRIITVNPGTDEVRVIYPTVMSQSFYTDSGGKFQMLENGNLLVTEAGAGRVFETDSSGRTVWEWIQEPYNDDLVPEVLEGTRYNLSPEMISSWRCE